MDKEIKQKYLAFLATLEIPEGFYWVAVDSSRAIGRENQIHFYSSDKILATNDQWCFEFILPDEKYYEGPTLPTSLQKDFPWEESLVHVSEIKTFKEENRKMKPKNQNYEFVRKINSLAEALIALGEGLVVSSDAENNVICGYILKEDKLTGILDSKIEYSLSHLRKELYDFKDTGLQAYKVKEINWYDNIPEQGVLCWVSDSMENAPVKQIIRLIKSVDYGNSYKFCSDNHVWKYAIPVTKQEIENLLLENQE